MSPRNPKNNQSMPYECLKMKKYHSLDIARIAVERAKSKGMHLEAYICPRCSFTHLSAKKIKGYMRKGGS